MFVQFATACLEWATTKIHRIAAVKTNIAEMFTKAASILKKDRSGWVPVDTLRLAETYEAQGRVELPRLAGIITAPTFARQDRLGKPGYDHVRNFSSTRVTSIFRFLSNPSKMMRSGANSLTALLSQFPFLTGRSGSGNIRVLTLSSDDHCLRPRCTFTAPPQVQENRFSSAASMIASGQLAPVTTLGTDEAEMEKKLAASLIAGDAIISLDNCQLSIHGDLLCQMLSQEVVRVRVLGQSLNIDAVSNAAMYATGNNLEIAGDMTRRVLLCSLNANAERPELRKFEKDPLALIGANRAHYVIAALTILRAYQIAASPDAGPPLASFERWCRWIRDALLWLGLPDVTGSPRRERRTLNCVTSLLCWRSGTTASVPSLRRPARWSNTPASHA